MAPTLRTKTRRRDEGEEGDEAEAEEYGEEEEEEEEENDEEEASSPKVVIDYKVMEEIEEFWLEESKEYSS